MDYTVSTTPTHTSHTITLHLQALVHHPALTLSIQAHLDYKHIRPTTSEYGILRICSMALPVQYEYSQPPSEAMSQEKAYKE